MSCCLPCGIQTTRGLQPFLKRFTERSVPTQTSGSSQCLHALERREHPRHAPAAELVDRILQESAYAFELAGSRRRQAWENVKKMRDLVRRIQNRGYATLSRIAEHLTSLSAGDESNAAIDAVVPITPRSPASLGVLSIIAAAASRIMLNVPIRLTRMTRS